MNIDKSILYVAVLIGVYQLFREIDRAYNMKNLKDIDTQYVTAGVIAGILWSVQQYREGSLYFSAYSAIGSMIGLYTLYRIHKERVDDERSRYVV